jgi:hypothetical protein
MPCFPPLDLFVRIAELDIVALPRGVHLYNRALFSRMRLGEIPARVTPRREQFTPKRRGVCAPRRRRTVAAPEVVRVERLERGGVCTGGSDVDFEEGPERTY